MCTHQKLRLLSSGHLAIIPIAVASGFIAGTAPVDTLSIHVLHRHGVDSRVFKNKAKRQKATASYLLDIQILQY